VDNSSLTGEADPQERGPNNTFENPLEATNLAFNGTLNVNGECYGIVIRTGDNTVLGQIANLAGSEKKRASPLTQEIEEFVHKIAIVAAISAIIFFSISLAKGQGIAFAINFAIGVFVSYVPEGLPATMTVLGLFFKSVVLPIFSSRCFCPSQPSVWQPVTSWSRI
jgi:sodium/potassium-transporting ATPase subunit alpha